MRELPTSNSVDRRITAALSSLLKPIMSINPNVRTSRTVNEKMLKKSSKASKL